MRSRRALSNSLTERLAQMRGFVFWQGVVLARSQEAAFQMM